MKIKFERRIAGRHSLANKNVKLLQCIDLSMTMLIELYLFKPNCNSFGHFFVSVFDELNVGNLSAKNSISCDYYNKVSNTVKAYM